MLNRYAVLAAAGVTTSLLMWWLLLRRKSPATGSGAISQAESDGKRRALLLVYPAGLFGAIVGAKLAFIFAEGFHYRNDWAALWSGKSVTGALLGGYVAVEIVKRLYEIRTTTGDAFALTVPPALILGRVGCLMQGCCVGVVCDEHWWTIADAHAVPRWPAAAVELLFNACFLAWAIVANRVGWARGNRFHVYLISYGLFRFAHEFARDDARWFGPITGYHVVAIALVALGVVRYSQRERTANTRSVLD